MLKIKDNVDLKELKKFGLREFKHLNKTEYWDICDSHPKERVIVNNDRTICIELDEFLENHISIDALFNLIKADLVERVEE